MFTKQRPIISFIEDMTADIPGWTPVDQLFALYTLAMTTSHLPGHILEVGAWCGRSTSVLGKAMQKMGTGWVHSIDLFPHRDDWRQNDDGTYTFQVVIEDETFVGYGEQTVWAEPFERDIKPVYEKFPRLEDAFDETIRKTKLQDVVKPYKGNLTKFLENQSDGFQIRLAFIDGDHCYHEVTRDIEHVEKILVSGGWICFDDAFSYYEGVDKAITEHIIQSGKYDICQQLTRKLFVARLR